MSSAAKYQRHVDGLRAVAVLAVILYHFSHRWFRGGYVGVDVFFAISGYLITRLIPLGMEVNVGKPSERPAGRSRQSGAGWRPRGFRFYWP
jgi:acyltransferase-like protein